MKWNFHKSLTKSIIALNLIPLTLCLTLPLPMAYGASGKFEEYEVRVIRPRYFTKRQRFELGAQLSVIMNESFIYTYFATGIMTFHFTESFAFEGSGGYGLSVDKDEKRLLKKEFDIKTQIFRSQYTMDGALLYTPAYGKWQLPSGQLVYFDTFLSFGGGMTGIEWRFSDFCTKPTAATTGSTVEEIPADRMISYPTLLFGAGQRFFITKDTALKIDIRDRLFFYDQADASCSPSTAESSRDYHQIVTMQLGASRYF